MTVPPSNELSRLDQQLDTLLSMLNHGEWDDLPELEKTLLVALEVAGRPSGSMPPSREQLQGTLAKLAQAIEACNIRKEQIAPLVNALTKPQTKP